MQPCFRAQAEPKPARASTRTTAACGRRGRQPDLLTRSFSPRHGVWPPQPAPQPPLTRRSGSPRPPHGTIGGSGSRGGLQERGRRRGETDSPRDTEKTHILTEPSATSAGASRTPSGPRATGLPQGVAKTPLLRQAAAGQGPVSHSTDSRIRRRAPSLKRDDPRTADAFLVQGGASDAPGAFLPPTHGGT